MKGYKHIVQYYETDRMGITHHSNYIRWMEETRVYYLKELGWSYERLEEEGIVSPVTAINCNYKVSTTFADEVEIEAFVAELRGVRMKIHYIMKKQDGQLVFEGYSEHCFLDKEGKVIRLEREYPGFYEALKSMLEND